MSRKILLLIMMGFSVAFGGFWALQAQDPPPQKPPSQVRTDPPTVSAQQTVQADLSGTYAGTFDCEPLGLTGDTTLTITGNEFTTADGKSGRIVASTTGGYTAVAFQMGTLATTPSTAPATPPVIVSMRARKTRDRLILTPAPGTAMKCSFTPARVARGKRTPKTPAATGTEVAAPVTPTESPMPSQTPAPSPTPSPDPSPSPEPSPTPSGSPTPAPSPTPSGSPTPIPSPTEPAPSPTPTPSPSPRG